jgi:hypothetical protein
MQKETIFIWVREPFEGVVTDDQIINEMEKD